MAYALNGTTQSLSRTDTCGFSDYPLTISCMVKPDNLRNQNQAIFGDTSALAYLGLNMRDPADNDILVWSREEGLFGWKDTTTSYTTGSWQHTAGVFSGATSRKVWLDGGGTQEDTVNVPWPAVLDNFYIGARGIQGSVDNYFNGDIAEVALWNVALTAAEILLLSNGASALLVRPANLVAYWPLVSNANDIVGGFNLTENGSPSLAEHPRIARPASRLIAPIGVGFTPVTIQRAPALPGIGGILLGVPIVTNLTFPPAEKLEPNPIEIEAPGWTAPTDGLDPRYNVVNPFVLDAFPAGSRTAESLRVADMQEGVAAVRTVQGYWYEHGHLLPRIAQELGNIISQQSFDIDLYNADRFEGLTISSVTDNLGAGISIAGVPATPFTIASQESLEAVVTVLTTGDLAIDASYTFHADTGDDYTFFILGTRIVLLPIRPEAPMREHLVFETRVLTADDGTEQRHAERKIPRGLFEMTFKDSRRLAEILLFDRQSKIVSFPAWHEPAFAEAITDLDTTVNVNTTNYANFYVGGYAIVFKDEFTFDALRIESMTSTSLTFDTPVSKDYVAGTQIMPLLTAYFNHSVAATKAIYNDQTFNVRLNTLAEDNDIASAAAFNTYNGKVLLDGPNMINGSLQEVFHRDVMVLDNVTGLWQEYSNWDRNKRQSVKGFKTRSRQELWEMRQLLHHLKGQQVSFYIPTFTKDLIPNQTLVNGSSVFQMDYVGYNINVRERDPKVFFRMLLKDGTVLTRSIVSSAKLSDAEEQLTVDNVWPYDIEPEDIERIDWLEKVRLNTDDIVIVHFNALGESQCFVPTTEVFD